MNSTTTKTKFSLPQRLGAWWEGRREAGRAQALRRRCPPATVAADQIPTAMRTAWAQHAPDELPGLAVDDGAWLRCSLGLAQFFEACRLQHGHGACALPSKAADSVWHAWLRSDAASLADWQQRFFGRVVEHIEAEALGAPLEASLARTWAGACCSEGLGLLGPQLPLLFELDGLLGLPAGCAYQHEGGVLGHRQIDGFGQPSGAWVAHAAIAGGGLVALGLLSEAELVELRRRQDSGSSCGAAAAAGDSGCASSADGGGCSCGGGS